MIVGILFALPIEQHRFVARLSEWERLETSGIRYDVGKLGETQCVSLVCGPGAANAKRGVERLLRDWKIEIILSAGFSGALIENLDISDLIVGSSVTNAETGETLTCDSSDLLPKSRHDLICMTNQIASTQDQKSEFHQLTRAIAVDLESFAVLETALKADVPGLVLRSISDEFQHEIPKEVSTILDDHGRPRIGNLFFSILKRPNFIFDLKRMFQRADRASKSLADGLVELIGDLS